jgi:hypothetical protein
MGKEFKSGPEPGILEVAKLKFIVLLLEFLGELV